MRPRPLFSFISSISVALVSVVSAACSDEPLTSSSTRTAGTEDDPGASSSTDVGRPPPPPVFEPVFRADAGARSSDGAPALLPTKDPVFASRLTDQIRAIVGKQAYGDHDWKTKIHADVPFSGVKIWIPGTGEATGDTTTSRAMGSVPSGLAEGGPAVTWASSSVDASGVTNVWLGVPCSQSQGGERFQARGKLSALEVFDTAWPDALAIVTKLGVKVEGAWIVGHSAGANPAILAGIIGRAHRVDAYGVPSTESPLDGDDGLVHAHTHPLDPAGAMGKIGGDGHAEIDLLGAAATTIKAGLTLDYHDYSGWPAPAP
jgi:hypothetical protein